nr:MAG TPA: IrrE protein [Caudoviricetes sp.]
MALTTFTYFNVLNFPVDIKTLIKSEGIKLKKYSTVAKKVGITVEEVCKEYQTDLAYIFRDNTGKYAIAYNDTKPEYMIRFSLAHELGHYVLLHLEDFDETVLRYRGSNLTEKKYSVLEREANCFARNLISPAPIADLIPQEVYREYFGIGFEAKQTRIGCLSSDKYYTKLLSDDIDEMHFLNLRKRLKHAHQCSVCNAIFSKKSISYCPFCGDAAPTKLSIQETIHIKTKGDYMKYSSIELDENNFPFSCPRCENEDIDSSDKFCSICATYLRNICIGSGPFDENSFSPYPTFELYKETQGCGKTLPGFARYCPDCGGKSSYYFQGLLKNWNLEKDIAEELPF